MEGNWLYDTGADVSVISKQLFEKFKNKPILSSHFGSLNSAANTKLGTLGTCKLKLEVLGKCFEHEVFVCENLNQEAILGIDAIQKLGLNYNIRKRQFSFDELNIISQTFSVAALSALSTEIFEPLTARPLRLSAQTDTGQRPPSGQTGVAEIHANNYPLLFSKEGLVKTNKLGEITLMVKNCYPYQITIPRGEILGSFEPVLEGTFSKIDEKKFVAEITQNKARPPPLNSAQQKDFLKDLKLNVPIEEKEKYLKLLFENHDVFSKTKNDLGKANNFKHEIQLKTKEPVYVKQFKIPESHRDNLVEQIKEWLKIGVIEPTNSRYNSPIFVVPKKDGSHRFVLDYRALNDNSMDDKYSMKDVSECIGDIGRAGSTIFSTMDLTSGFWQLPLEEKSKPYTAFTCPGLGQFAFKVLSMGLKGGPGSFQRMAELTVKDMDRIIVYIDDLLAHAHTHDQHRKDLNELFHRLRNVNLKLNLKKCEFGSTNVSYLGFRLTPQGILPGIDKLKVVREAKPPTTVTQIRQFLGLCNFFRSHVRNFAQISAPLNQLTRKDTGWRGGELPKEARDGFFELRSALISEPIVSYPRKDRPYSLIVDASTGGEGFEGGFGAILCQQDKGGNFHVIAYASRGLQTHEKNYTPYLAEMMSAVWAMGHFDTYLRGKHFTLFTDHRPLEKLGKVHTKTLNRLQEAMNEFDFEIKYKKGSEMPADFLSRNVLCEIDLFMPDLPNLQKQDAFCAAVINYLKNGILPIEKNKQTFVEKIAKECFIEKEILWRRLKRNDFPSRTVLVVPVSLTEQLVKEAHGTLLTGHNGITKTKERILESYYWPSMEAEITAHIQSCVNCQSHRKDDRPKPHFLSPLPQCSTPNQRVHMDLFGPLKTSDSGKKYVMCFTDAFTKYCEMVALPNKEATTVASAVFNRWICRYGTPLEFVTDGGKEFANNLNKELFKILKVEHSITSPYHPQCNAQAEVANKTIAKYLSMVVNQNTLDWELYLPPLMFSYNTSLHRSIKATPYFLTYGLDARLPNFPAPDIRRFYGENEAQDHIHRLQLCRQVATEENLKATQKAQTYHNSQSEQHKYIKGQLVWLDVRNFLGKNRKLAPNWEGPFPITRVFDNGVVDVFKNNRHHRVNVNRLKPYLVKDGIQTRKVSIPEDETPHLKNKEIIFENKFKQAQTRPAEKDINFQQPQNEQTTREENFDYLLIEPPRGEELFTPNNNILAPPVPNIIIGQSAGNAPRQRGRPRKAIISNSPSPQIISPPSMSHQTNGQSVKRTQVQMENIIPASQNLREGQRLTRAQGRLAERAQLSNDAQVNLVKVLNTWAISQQILKNINNISLLTKRNQLVQQLNTLKSAVNKHKQYNYFDYKNSVVDQFNLFKDDKTLAANKRRNFLKKLSPSARNLILTGDPGFAFDPAVYEQILNHPPGVPVPIGVHQQFDYLLPDVPEIPEPVNPEPEEQQPENEFFEDVFEENFEDAPEPELVFIPDPQGSPEFVLIPDAQSSPDTSLEPGRDPLGDWGSLLDTLPHEDDPYSPDPEPLERISSGDQPQGAAAQLIRPIKRQIPTRPTARYRAPHDSSDSDGEQPIRVEYWGEFCDDSPPRPASAGPHIGPPTTISPPTRQGLPQRSTSDLETQWVGAHITPSGLSSGSLPTRQPAQPSVRPSPPVSTWTMPTPSQAPLRMFQGPSPSAPRGPPTQMLQVAPRPMFQAPIFGQPARIIGPRQILQSQSPGGTIRVRTWPAHMGPPPEGYVRIRLPPGSILHPPQPRQRLPTKELSGWEKLFGPKQPKKG